MLKKTAERSCKNCAFRDGCQAIYRDEVCSEHEFEDEGGEDELTEEEKKSILADKQYQAFKEEDF